MYIDKIQLTNIRGFKHLDFSLARPDGSYAGWTVFTGDNGGGKSTLLKAIAQSLISSETSTRLIGAYDGWIRHKERSGDINVGVVGVSTDDPIAKNDGNFDFDFNELITQVFTRFTLDGVFPTVIHGSSLPKKLTGWFSCGYGPYRRVFGSSAETSTLMSNPQTATFVTLFQESASLAEVDQWLRHLNHKALGKSPGAQTQLDVVLNILSDELLPNGITIDRVDYDGLWLKDKNGLQLSWGDMSDGYRSALALLADILRHMIEAYGVEDLTGVDADGKLFIKRSGVVLIDEIDAHLHPSWQREIGFWLKKHFPAIQFLVTTHSPIICQAADPNGLFVLPSPASDDVPRPMSPEEYQRIIASTSDGILLTDAFGLQNTRSEKAVNQRVEFSRLTVKANAGAVLSSTEQARLVELDELISAAED